MSAINNMAEWLEEQIKTLNSYYKDSSLMIAAYKLSLEKARRLASEEANAPLIAAAPELLAALEKMLPEYIDNTQGINDEYGNPYNPYEDEIVIQVRAAIAKAKGTI